MDVTADLAAAGLTPTRARRAVAMLFAPGGPAMTSQQAHAYLRDSGDPVGLSTVYRTLSALSDAGILHVLDAADEARYRRCGGEVHVHLLCTACGKVTTDADPELPSLLQRAARRQRLRPTAFRIEIEGVCLDCAMP